MKSPKQEWLVVSVAAAIIVASVWVMTMWLYSIPNNTARISTVLTQ